MGVLQFERAVGGGYLYEWIQQELKLESREDAKEMMFEVLFGTKRKTDTKQKLRSLIPDIVDFLEDLKSEYSYKEIPITLQNVEASVMIDMVLAELHNQEIPALSKHDSILIPESYTPLCERAMCKILDSTLINYKTKRTYFSP